MMVLGTARAEPISPAEISVSDGDTIRAHGKTYRLVGFDTPEIDRAKCAIERQLGAQREKYPSPAVEGTASTIAVGPFEIG